MNSVELKELLKSKTEPFFKRLKHAAQNELEFWENRPGSLPRELLVKYIGSLDENSEFKPNEMLRESDGGKFGETGFKSVFYYQDDFIVIGRKYTIYIKGFFFEEEDPRGVEIQSFKKSTRLTKVK